ncbi:hypothetical protein [Streptomyces sp. NPDC008150]|uniref:hypothetical protein n=1 Tax=Streptomyces sp. NPDC008150 TaxID=3364816 RepID=UPI0036EE4D0B
MDINALFTKDGMRAFTAEQRDLFMNDGRELRQMEQIVQARLAQLTVDGDRPGAAGRRARRIARKLGRIAASVEKAAAQAEALNAAYVHDIVELPERRARQLEAKAARKNRLGIAATTETLVTNSLTKSVHGLHGTTPVGNPQVTTAPQPQYVHPMNFPAPQAGGQSFPSITDLFDQEAM